MLKIIEAENAKPASVLGYRRKKYFAATGGFFACGEDLLLKTPRKSCISIEGLMTDKEYDQLYESHWAKAVNLCKKLLGKDYDRDAEDCAQEVFMAAWKKRDKITSPAEQWINEAIRLQCLKLKELSKRYDQWGMPIDMERIAK